MSTGTVTTMGYLPASEASLPMVVLMGYSNGAEAPAPPPEAPQPTFYGPALSPAERRRWFGDEEEEGLLARTVREVEEAIPDDLPAEAREQVEAFIDTRVRAKLPEVRPIGPIDQQRVLERVAKSVKAEIKHEIARARAEAEVRRLDEEDEEREAMALLAGMLFLG